MSQLVVTVDDPPNTPKSIQQFVSEKIEAVTNDENKKKTHWLLYYWRQQVVWFIIIWVALEANFFEPMGRPPTERSKRLSTGSIYMIFGFLATIQSWLLSTIPFLLFVIFPVYLIARRFFNKYVCFKVVDLYLFRIGSFILLNSFIFLINLPQIFGIGVHDLNKKDDCFIDLISMTCSKFADSNVNSYLFLMVGTMFFFVNATFTIFQRFNTFRPNLTPLTKTAVFGVSFALAIALLFLYMCTILLSVTYMVREKAFPDDVGRIIWLLCTLVLSLTSYRFFIRYAHQNLDVIFNSKSFTPI